MKKIIPVVIIFLAIIGLVFFAYKNNLFNKKPAGLEINASPNARVYIDGVDSGTTPYVNKGLKPGTYTLKLIPDGGIASAYETKVNLVSSTSTFISRVFSSTEADSSGYVLEFSEEPGGKAYLSVVSDPDTANLVIDGKPQGYTPESKLDLTPGSHEIALSSPGYKPQTISVNTLSGFNLIAKLKLGSDTIVLASPTPSPESSIEPSASPKPSSSPLASTSPVPSASPRSSLKPSPSPISKPYVLVEETGTGWLRVRKEPSSQGDELGKADVGAKLKYLGETTEDGWHKVEFTGLTGWVSGKYATLVK